MEGEAVDNSTEVWQPYPDPTQRGSLAPLPTKGGNPNAVASDGVVAAVASQHQRSVHAEAEFRARQYARRLLTRGKAAMRDPAPPQFVLLPTPDLPPIPDDPESQAYRAAGWV